MNTNEFLRLRRPLAMAGSIAVVTALLLGGSGAAANAEMTDGPAQTLPVPGTDGPDGNNTVSSWVADQFNLDLVQKEGRGWFFYYSRNDGESPTWDQVIQLQSDLQFRNCTIDWTRLNDVVCNG